MKITITDITDHFVDEQMMHGDSSHVGWADVYRLHAEEYEQKVENNKWDGLPYTCEADSLEEAIDLYNEDNCRYDYIKAADADFEEE